VVGGKKRNTEGHFRHAGVSVKVFSPQHDHGKGLK